MCERGLNYIRGLDTVSPSLNPVKHVHTQGMVYCHSPLLLLFQRKLAVLVEKLKFLRVKTHIILHFFLELIFFLLSEKLVFIIYHTLALCRFKKIAYGKI
jgi:hypothetical protein